MALLSKSRYLAGLQCPRLLWVRCNEPDRLAEADKALEFTFDQGHFVGAQAKRRYPDGIEIDWDLRLDEVFRRTQEALRERRPVFEAGFEFEGAFTRADILVPVGRREWDVIEVKSASKVKPVHLEDLAFQRHVYEGAGLPVRQCHLMLIDTSYVRDGDVDPKALFKLQDVTRDIEETVGNREDAQGSHFRGGLAYYVLRHVEGSSQAAPLPLHADAGAGLFQRAARLSFEDD